MITVNDQSRAWIVLDKFVFLLGYFYIAVQKKKFSLSYVEQNNLRNFLF